MPHLLSPPSAAGTWTVYVLWAKLWSLRIGERIEKDKNMLPVRVSHSRIRNSEVYEVTSLKCMASIWACH